MYGLKYQTESAWYGFEELLTDRNRFGTGTGTVLGSMGIDYEDLRWAWGSQEEKAGGRA